MAVTYGGANDWQQDFAGLFKNANVIILADNDEQGKRVANVIQRDLQGIAKSAKVIVPMPDMPKETSQTILMQGIVRQSLNR